MSYLNRTQDPRRRATAMVTVGAVHALQIYAPSVGQDETVPDQKEAPIAIRRRAVI